MKSKFAIFVFFLIVFFYAQIGNVSATERISGSSRYSTAVKVSQEGWNSSNTVILTKGTNFPDALAGGPLAYQENAPILLTEQEKLPDVTKNEIKRLKAKKVIILGSASAVSKNIENELKNLGITVTRIGGSSRYETAALIAEKINSSKVIIANGENFPDALAIAPYAARNGIPILLTQKDKLPGATLKALNGKKEAIIVGGTGVIHTSVEQQLPQPKRYSGGDRYSTAKEIITKLPLDKKLIYITSGENFPDALAGSVLAAKNNASIALVKTEEIPAAIASVLKAYKTIDVIGGEAAVSKQTLFDSTVTSIINKIIKPGMTDVEKSYAIFDYLQENVVYDGSLTRYTAYDALVDHSSVCDGYARATQILMERVGIESRYVTGTIGGALHAWNLIKINNQYYHFDATNFRFLQNDKTFSDGYEWDRSYHPKSNGVQLTPGGYDFFLRGNDVYYNSSYKEGSFGTLKLLRRKPDGREEVVTTLEPGGWLLKYEGDWIYYASRGDSGEIYRKNFNNLNQYETIKYNNDWSHSIDDFDVKNGWIYIYGRDEDKHNIIKINPDTLEKQVLFEVPYQYSVPVGTTYKSLNEVNIADEWIYYSVATYLQEDQHISGIIKEEHFKMKHDGSNKTLLRSYNR